MLHLTNIFNFVTSVEGMKLAPHEIIFKKISMIKSSILTFLFLFVFLNTGKAQVFWTERFENGCTSNCKADTSYKGPNGSWTTKSGFSSEGANANDWYISCAVPGRRAGLCNDIGACVETNRCLHLCSINDAGAGYTKAPTGITDKRVESPKIDCSTKSNIKVVFDFICLTDTLLPLQDQCYFEYSADNGTNWTVLDSNFMSSTCVLHSVIPMWTKYEKNLPSSADNNANVRIGFHWKNKATTALNTGFAVDSIRLSVSNVITTGPILGSPFCACSVVQVPYNGTGNTFTSGNKFIAELSDATGSFANPTQLQSITTTADTGHITVFIPCSTPAGAAYRIRVKSTTPSPGGIIGADNGVNLVINAPIVVTATPNPDTICAGGSGVIKALGGDPGHYQWYDPSNMSTPKYTNVDSIVVTPALLTYILFGQKGNCIDSTIVKIAIQPKPVVNVTNDTTCIGLGAVLKATGGTKYLWGDGSKKDSLVIFPTKDTMVIVSITKGYCTVKDTGYVKVFNKISVSVNSPTICRGDAVKLTATGAINYIWSNQKTTPDITVSPTTNTSYTVTGMAGSCSDTKIATVTVNPRPDVKVETPAPVCEGESVTLTATGATTYVWNAAVPNPLQSTITVKTPISRFYTVVGFTNACPDTATVFVTIDQRPNVTVNSDTICLGGSAVLTADGAHHYLWETGDTTKSITVNPQQDKIYKVFGFSENGSCKDTAYGYITVGVPVAVHISGNTDIFSCESTVLSADPADGTYSWGVIGSSDGKINCPTCPVTSVTPAHTLPYVVTYTSPAGCIGLDTILVNVKEINSYFLATALTPNGDGVNDVVQVHGRGIDHISFMIFDRIGEKVFETHEIETGWDGTYLGGPMNDNVFVYRLEIYFCNGETQKETGNITILR